MRVDPVSSFIPGIGSS